MNLYMLILVKQLSIEVLLLFKQNVTESDFFLQCSL